MNIAELTQLSTAFVIGGCFLCYNNKVRVGLAKFVEILYNISMLKLLNKAIRSRTVWTVVFMVVANIVNALAGVVSPEVLTLINTLLGALTVYFRITPSVKF
jgi:hypothetical protein